LFDQSTKSDLPPQKEIAFSSTCDCPVHSPGGFGPTVTSGKSPVTFAPVFQLGVPSVLLRKKAQKGVRPEHRSENRDTEAPDWAKRSAKARPEAGAPPVMN